MTWLVTRDKVGHLILLDDPSGVHRTVCGLQAVGRKQEERPPFLSLCLDCVEHDAQTGGTPPLEEPEPVTPAEDFLRRHSFYDPEHVEYIARTKEADGTPYCWECGDWHYPDEQHSMQD